MGDKVDNIIGIHGIGIKKAEKILAKSKDRDATIESYYKDEFGEGWYQRMVQNTQLLWMLQKDVKMPMDIRG
jgi:5'-3' exonuclease